MVPATEGLRDRIRVHFTLPRDEEGWPPVDSETVWAELLAPTVAKVDSIPWFVRDIALEDLISIDTGQVGQAIFIEKLKWSGNCTLRVVPLADDTAAGIRDILDRVADLGVECEVLGQYGLVAINARPAADLGRLKRLLTQGEERGWWSYEEGCVGGDWF